MTYWRKNIVWVGIVYVLFGLDILYSPYSHGYDFMEDFSNVARQRERKACFIWSYFSFQPW